MDGGDRHTRFGYVSIIRGGLADGVLYSPSDDALQHDFGFDAAESPVAVEVEQPPYLLQLQGMVHRNTTK